MTIRTTGIRKALWRRSGKWLIVASAGLAVPFSGALGQGDALPKGFKTEPLLKTGETRDGDSLHYPKGKPQITSVVGTIEPGGRTPLHQHPVPAYVYILEGQVELRTAGRDPRVFRRGEAYIEALNRDHQLFNAGDAPAKVLVVFVGEDGSPTTVAAKH
jgi:quercetin dioxygenase-like cupin family protein